MADAPLTVVINGDSVPCEADPGVDISKCMAAKMFQEWVAAVDPKFLITKITFQSIDMFGPNPGFMKFKADTFERSTKKFLPGIIFMRGGSVGILTILVSEEEGQEFSVMVTQPRLPSGSFASMEIPAGMLDASSNFKGKAADELKEETGIVMAPDELIDLTALANVNSTKGVYLSPGGCDEFMRFFLYKKVWPKADIESLQGKLAGNREENELITVEVIPYEDMVRVPDGKTLVSVALYERLRPKLP